MTTVLADARLGVMVSDSNMAAGDRVWSVRKVIRSRGALIGCSGNVSEGEWFREWWKAGANTAPDFDFTNSTALVLDASGLYIFDESTVGLTRVKSGREAIGSGAVAAICAYEATCWTDPVRAVRIACKHDSQSRAPVRKYHLKEA